MAFRQIHLSPLLLFVLAAQTCAAHGRLSSPTEDLVADSILKLVLHKDCAGAVKALNQGIADKYPSVLLLAGSMFEQGVCLKPDWDKAALYYQLAHTAGKREALPRLIAGHAEKNRDPGAALWWLAQYPSLPAPCRSANHLANDPDAFVAALNKWPKGLVAACAYTGGVLMRVSGDVEFPGPGAARGVVGDAIMRFSPSTRTITWTAVPPERSDPRQVRTGRESPEVFDETFLKHVRTVSERALMQFARPEGIDPAWALEVRFSFKLED